jgi:hypothetical protein
LGIICRGSKKDRQEKASFGELKRRFELAKKNNQAQPNKTEKMKRRIFMNRSRVLVLGGLLTAALITPAMPALADQDHFEHHENNGKHKGWEKSTGKKFDEHDRRNYRHPDPRFSHRDTRHDYRGHHNKAEIHQDFKDVRNARKEVSDSRTELRKDYTELRNDRTELRRDLRNGASKAEILKDRQEIKGDLKEIHGDRIDLRNDQAKLDGTRRELRSDLHKR